MSQYPSSPGLVFLYRFTLARFYFETNRLLKARQILADIIDRDPSFSPAYSILASSYISRGRLEQAKMIIEQGERKSRKGELAPLSNLKGVIAQKEKRLEDSEYWFYKSLLDDPNFYEARINRGVRQLRKGNVSAAQQDLEEVLRWSGNHSQALTIYAIILDKLNKPREARDMFNKAIESDQENPTPRLFLGVHLMRRNLDRHQSLRMFSEVGQLRSATEKQKIAARFYLEKLRKYTLILVHISSFCLILLSSVYSCFVV